jgi:hypothetical protein
MKSCKKGYYYCFTDKKCKKIPKGWHLMSSGYIMRDKDHEDKEEEKKKNGNGHHSNGNGDGSGESNGGSNGGGDGGSGVAEGWSAKYKKSIDCNNPKGFSQRAHCQGRKKMNEAKNGDHEVAMAQSQLAKAEKNIAKLRTALGKKEKDIPAWMQAKITDTAHDTDAAAGYVDKISEARDGKSAKDKGYSLRDWFKGGGWVQAGGKYDGKPCAKQPGQKTKPFCRDADDRASMSKDERERRAKKKRREDPNPDRKGKAKMVSASYSNWRAEFLDEANIGFSNPAIKGKPVPYPKGHPEEGKPMSFNKAETEGKNKYDRYYRKTGKRISADEPLPQLPEEKIVEGKKDACYHKVKSRYSVWPSAYASGALVKCRKAGAKNWGNKTKKESYDFSNWRDDFKAMEFEFVDIIKPEPMKGLSEAKKCWPGYEKKGTKKMFGKTYNNCVKKEEFESVSEAKLGKCEKNKIEKYVKGMKKNKSSFKDSYGADAKPVMYATATNMAKKACKEEMSDWRTELGEDWQKVNRGDKTDGMSQKAVNAYKRENPGSKLQTAVTEKKPTGKRAKRRKSFCARSNGQRKMHNIDCSKTPEKKICKARKRWNCE